MLQYLEVLTNRYCLNRLRVKNEEIAARLGLDKIIFQDLGDLIAAVSACSKHIREFETSIFDGHYVTGDVSEYFLQQIALERND